MTMHTNFTNGRTTYSILVTPISRREQDALGDAIVADPNISKKFKQTVGSLRVDDNKTAAQKKWRRHYGR